MATRTPRKPRGGGQSKGGGEYNQDPNRVKVGVAWINPDEIAEQILADVIGAEKGRLKISVEDDIQLSKGQSIFMFANKAATPENRAPHFDLITFLSDD